MKHKIIAFILIILVISYFSTCCTDETATDSTTETATEETIEETTTATPEITGRLGQYVGGELADFMAAVDEIGYTATYYNQGEDWTDILPLDDTWANDYLVKGVRVDEEAESVTVYITLKPTAGQEEQEESEEYGESDTEPEADETEIY